MSESHTELAKHLSRLKAGIRRELLAHINKHPIYSEGIIELADNLCGLATDIFLDISKKFELKEREKWQPIETAPKDGEAIILTNGGAVVYGYFEEDCNKWLYHDYPDNYNLYPFIPTHWMPLPEPPTE